MAIKHIHSISGGRVTRAKCLHGKYSSGLGEIPPLSAGNSPRRVTRLHHVNSHPGILLVSIIARISPLPSNSPSLPGTCLHVNRPLVFLYKHCTVFSGKLAMATGHMHAILINLHLFE